MTIEKPLILIVDDQKINREILKGILNEDYRCVEAVNGEEAFKVLEANPDVAAVLLDLVMPVMGGRDFLKKIKASPYDEIPVLAVTGSIEEGTEQEVLDLGARDFVTKPYQPMTLLSRLKNALANEQNYLVSSLIMDSLTDPSVIFRYNENGDIKAVAHSASFDQKFQTLLAIDHRKRLQDQLCLSEEDVKKLEKAFASSNDDNYKSELTLKVTTTNNEQKDLHIILYYWGMKAKDKILVSTFSFK
jgi:CheY-like chemotaxis protein